MSARLALILFASSLALAAPTAQAHEALSQLLNAYRAAHGLPAVPASPSLDKVAEAHARDLERHTPQGACNMHSWSNNGPWSACCYTDDHARAQCMWDKPREITGGLYRSEGFEISAWYSARMTPEIALASWHGSPAHLGLLLNREGWSDVRWQAMGTAISEHYAVVWFGETRDPAAKTPAR